jgi:hypothetical protein
LGPMLYGCRLLGVPVAAYVRRAFVAPLLLAAGPAAALAALVAWRSPENWIEFFLYGGIYAVAYVAVAAVGLLGWRRVQNLLRTQSPRRGSDLPTAPARHAAPRTEEVLA